MVASAVDESDRSPVSPDVFDHPADRYKDRYLNTTYRRLEFETPEDLTDIELRLDFLRILNPRDIGRGDIAVVAVTADNLARDPFELKLQTFQDIRAGQEISFGDAGVTVYRNPSGQIPRYIEYRLLAVELDAEIRDAGKWLDELANDPNYAAIRDALIAAVGAAQPQIGVIAAGVDLLVQFVAAQLKSNRDDQLVFVAGSYNTKLDHIKAGTRTAYAGTDYAQLAYSLRAG